MSNLCIEIKLIWNFDTYKQFCKIAFWSVLLKIIDTKSISDAFIREILFYDTILLHDFISRKYDFSQHMWIVAFEFKMNWNRFNIEQYANSLLNSK